MCRWATSLRLYNDCVKISAATTPTARSVSPVCATARRTRGQRNPSRREDGAKRPRILVLTGHGADVAPELRAVLGFWQAVNEVQLPLHFHTLPTTPPRARQEAPQVRRAAMFTGVSGVSDGADPHHRGDDGGKRVRVLSAPARVVRRERCRLPPMRCTAWDGAEAERRLKPLVQANIPVRPNQRQADRRHRRRDDDVGLELPTPRRNLAGILEIYRRAVRRPLTGGRAQNHLRERRQILQPAQCSAGRSRMEFYFATVSLLETSLYHLGLICDRIRTVV
jgi:hypothetical protein